MSIHSIWALQQRFEGTQFTSLYNDSEIVHPEHGGNSFILGCSITTLDVTYSWLNNTVSSVSYEVANGSVAINFFSPLDSQGSSLAQAINLAGVQSTSSELADSFAGSFSFLALSLLSGAYSPRANIEEQTRAELLVTRVSKASLLGLVVCNLMFSLFGMILAVWALISVSNEARGLDGRVSLEGLVQTVFETEKEDRTGEIEDLFEEKQLGEASRRVGIRRTGHGLQIVSMGV